MFLNPRLAQKKPPPSAPGQQNPLREGRQRNVTPQKHTSRLSTLGLARRDHGKPGPKIYSG